jgi:hypothetical protein
MMFGARRAGITFFGEDKRSQGIASLLSDSPS